jgi:hypothetical protein
VAVHVAIRTFRMSFQRKLFLPSQGACLLQYIPKRCRHLSSVGVLLYAGGEEPEDDVDDDEEETQVGQEDTKLSLIQNPYRNYKVRPLSNLVYHDEADLAKAGHAC